MGSRSRRSGGTGALTIGVDARAAAEVPAGRGRLVRELLRAIAASDSPHRFVLYARTPWDEVPDDRRFRWSLTASPDPLWHARAAWRADRECDVFFATNSYLPPLLLRIPSVLFIHDLIALLPGTHPRLASALIEISTLAPAARRAARLVCNSEATRRDLEGLLPDVARRVSVALLAADPRFAAPMDPARGDSVRRRYGLDRPYVLSVGTLEPRKNLPRLVRAFARLPREGRDRHLLALVGPMGWEVEEIRGAARVHSAHVRVLGHVPEDDLAALYGGCAVFAYPSLYEGFGLPVLEAMSAGAPVMTSGVSSLPEVGGDAAVYVDPRDVGEMAGALEALLSSPGERARLSDLARARAKEFTWAGTARRVLAAIEGAAAAGSPLSAS